MSWVLRMIGYGWAALGVIGCWGAGQAWDAAGDDVTAARGVSMGAAVLLFVLPGLVVGGLGSLLARRDKQA